MQVIEEHPYTREELIHQKGEEAAQYMYWVYEQILIGLLVLISLRFLYITGRQVVRSYVWTLHIREQWVLNRRKRFS